MLDYINDNENRFQIDGKFIVCNKYIEIKYLKYDDKERFLSQQETIKIKKLGYGITNFKVLNTSKIMDVFCEGRHVNVNENDKTFCLPVSLIASSMTIDNLNFIYGCMTGLDLNYCYSRFIHMTILEGFLI
tara:strand:+ start:2018 stop:2410 length:393 start_codon:yes stop_codon:yes gene_type:complete